MDDDPWRGAAVRHEVDIAAPERGDHVDELEAIGRGSDFEERFGFYVDPVDWDTGDFPSGWTDRLLTWSTSDDFTVMVPEPHDLAAAKLSASRTQDIDFVAALLLAQWLDVETLHDRVHLLADVASGRADAARPSQGPNARASWNRSTVAAARVLSSARLHHPSPVQVPMKAIA